jgi:hypothetical protein
MSGSAVDIVRYYAARALLSTVRRNELRTIPLAHCVNPLGFAFSEGWHHLVEFLRANPSLPEDGGDFGLLRSYFASYSPAVMSVLPAAAGKQVSFSPPFFTYPWGNFRLHYHHGIPVKDIMTTRFCGPLPEERIRAEAMAMVRLARRLASVGYRPWTYPNTFIGGVLLRRETEERFVVLQGNHRVAALSFLGAESIETRSMKGYWRVLSKDQVDSWYYVANGKCSREDALAYFDMFFVLNGTERRDAILASHG